MKKISLLTISAFLTVFSFAQRPSKEQMEKDKKAYAEAQKKLNEQLSKMDPKARQAFDSMMNSMGMGQKINDANNQVYNNQSAPQGKSFTGIVPAKNTKAIASIGATPSNAGMSSFITSTGKATFSAVLPAAQKKADEIYKALKSKGTQPDQMGNAAIALWMDGRSQIAMSLMVQICNADPYNTDNLGNYAAMLTMMGAPELAIPILNNLNAKFKKNSTILNNLGQAWFALGDMDKSKKCLDSTLMMVATHAQANETLCLIEESKGNKTAATSHAKTAFRQGATTARRDKLNHLGYKIGAGDYNSNFPPPNKSDDLLNLGGFSMPAFPKSTAECKVLNPIWKQFRSDINNRLKPLQKITEESNKKMANQLEEMQKQFMKATDKTISNPGSVSQSEAVGIVRAPMFSEKMNLRENIVLQNLQQKKQAAINAIFEFQKGEGASLKKKYDEAIKKANDKLKEAGEGNSVDEDQICHEKLKATDEFLSKYNEKIEGLYNEYLSAEKQLLNEFSYSSLYSTYPELLPGINAGLQSQWLRALSLTQNGFNFQSIELVCSDDDADGKGGKLTAFKDPNCNINSDLSQTLGIANLGFSIKLNCSGMTTTFNALILGVKLTQDLDHAGFGDSFKSCTVSIGPKAGVDVKMGPVEASAKVGGGVDIEIDREGIKDVIVKGGVEAEASLPTPGMHDPGQIGNPVTASAGMEGRISLNTGAGSIQGTGIFDNFNKK